MDIENLDLAIRYKARLDKLKAAKELIEKNASTTNVDLIGGLRKDAPHVCLHDDVLTGIILKYCDDTIKLIEDAIWKL